MAKFQYRVLNSAGEKIEGKQEAGSKEEVLAMITSNGYYPLKVEEIVESPEIQLKFLNKVTTKDIYIFCRQFYTMLNAGLTINNAIHILSEQVENKLLRTVLNDIEDDVKKGETLSLAMGKHKDVFPELLLSMVEAGEISGNLDTIMLRMSNHYEKENKINNKVKNAMTYPIILSIVAVGVVFFLITYIVPTFMDMFEETGTSLPITTKMLIAMSEFIGANIIGIFIALAIIVAAIIYYRKTESGKYTFSKLKLFLPVIKPLNEKIIVSRFSRTLSTLMASGVPMMAALPIVASVIGNKIAEDNLITVREKVARGEELSKSLKEAEIFPEMLYAMIKIGEESGTLDDILAKTADFYDEEVDTAIQTATTLVEPAMIIVLGGIVGFIIISILTPLFQMYGNI